MTSYEIQQAITFGRNITTYLTSAMIDAYGTNDRENGDKYSIDCATVLGMIKCLEFYQLNGSDTEFTDTDILSIINKIHEYDYALLLSIEDYSSQVGSDEDALGAGNNFVFLKSGTVVETAQSYSWTVAVDGDDTFQMPFNVAQIDTDSVSLTLNDADPILTESYTLNGTTLAWIGEYPLSAGWKFEIKWWGTGTLQIPN